MDSTQVAGEAYHELSHRTSKLRAWRFEIALLFGIVLAGVLAAICRSVGYFTLDVEITRAIQGLQAPGLDAFLHAVSWIGYPPQSNVIFGTVILALFLIGLRFEAVMTLFAAAGSAGLWFWLSAAIDRPRPTPDLVRVATELPTGGFPSGHVLNLTAIFGFLVFLTLILVAAVRWRSLLIALLSVPILTIGVARVYDGAHWPSDVLGGYLIGGIWLGLTIYIYRLARERVPFLRQRGHRAGHHDSPEHHESGMGQPA